MKNIFHTLTLSYCDGPQVFEARDSIGGHYVAVLAESTEEADRFILAGVSPERMREFKIGKIDLTALVLDRTDEEWFISEFGNPASGPMILYPSPCALVDYELLPLEGFYLRRELTDNSILLDVAEHNNLILEVVFEPPESSQSHRIHLDTLSELLSEIQSIVSYAYKKTLSKSTTAARKLLDEFGSRLDVLVPATDGSFRVVLGSATPSDLAGYNELTRAMDLVDSVFSSCSDPQTNLSIVKENSGHFASAYIRLLRTLIENDTNFRYAWAEPFSNSVRSHGIGWGEAFNLIALFDQEHTLGSEVVSHIGIAKKVDEEGGTWRLKTEKGDVSGGTSEGGPSLSGVTIGRSYKFACIEKLIENSIGKSQKSVLMNAYDEV